MFDDQNELEENGWFFGGCVCKIAEVIFFLLAFGFPIVMFCALLEKLVGGY